MPDDLLDFVEFAPKVKIAKISNESRGCYGTEQEALLDLVFLYENQSLLKTILKDYLVGDLDTRICD